jgi:hypothetical protein
MAQMHLTSRGFHCSSGSSDEVMRAVHTALARGFFVLLDGHAGLLQIEANLALYQGFGFLS